MTVLAVTFWGASVLGGDYKPWLDVQLESYQLELRPLDLEPSGRIVISASHYPSHLGWANLLSWSTYCFLGTVDRVRYDCGLASWAGAVSAAVVQFSVDEVYWGPSATSAVFEIDVTRPDCAVSFQWPTFSEFTTGDKYLLIGPRGAHPNRLISHHVYRLVSNGLVGEDGALWAWSEVLSAIESERDVRPTADDRITR